MDEWAFLGWLGGCARDAAGPLGGDLTLWAGVAEVVVGVLGAGVVAEAVLGSDDAAPGIVAALMFSFDGVVGWAKDCSVFATACCGVDAVAVAFAALLPLVPLPPRPDGVLASPRSRCRILAAALALPRSRFLSASTAVAVLFGVTFGVTLLDEALLFAVDGAGDTGLFVFGVCLLNTLTASRAVCSTLTA